MQLITMQVIEMLSEELHVNGDGCRSISAALKPNTRRRYSFGGRQGIFHSEDSWDRRIGKVDGILPRRYRGYVAILRILRHFPPPVDLMTETEVEELSLVHQTADPLPNGGSLESINPEWEPVTIGSKLPPSLLSEIGRNING